MDECREEERFECGIAVWEAELGARAEVEVGGRVVRPRLVGEEAVAGRPTWSLST